MSFTSQQYAGVASHVYLEGYPTGVFPPGKSKPLMIEGVIYQFREHVDDPLTGYQGTIYQRVDTGEMIVAHRGTEFDREAWADGMLADGGMVFDRMNLQAPEAIELTRHALNYAAEYARNHSGKTPQVTVTGHSLGGTLAQICAHHFGLKGETFNAYGAASLGMRIPEGGDAVLNHVMATDMVSAASPQYGQVRLYATPVEIVTLIAMGYANNRDSLDRRAPLPAAFASLEAHGMDNFLDTARHASALTDPSARQLARQYAPMIDKYRFDVGVIRLGLTIVARGPVGNFEDIYLHSLGPLAMGAPAVAESQRAPVAPATRENAPRAAGNASSPDLAQTLDALDRMLAAAKSGDWASFHAKPASDRREPQTAAPMPPQVESIAPPIARGPRMR